MRVIVCGGRDYQDFETVVRVLDALNNEKKFEAVIHGNARGADTLGGKWAERRGVRCWPKPANWAKHGRSAGPKRNQAMLGMGVDLVVAFAGGRGTQDMVRRAEKAGVRVHHVSE